MMENWYQLDRQAVLKQLNVDLEAGLSEEEAAKRLQEYGPNELVERGTKSPWRILLEQLSGVMIVILIVSAIISVLLHEYTDAIVILVIVVLNALLGFTQEYRAEQAMAALKQMAVPIVRARRGGHIHEVKAQGLAPGDIILLEAGSAIPADARLLDAANLRVQEAVLTGESEPVEKVTGAIERENLPLGDRLNMLYTGTVATYGRGTAVVVETGMRTELGHIAEMIQTVGQEQTPLQRRLGQLGKGLALAALGIVALVFFEGVLRGQPVRLMFQTAISMAVAAVPEGLPAVVTIALALGAQRMLSRNALIRKLPAVETLGSVTVICSDKTGTLTENRMTVTVLDVAGNFLNLKERLSDFSPTVSPADEVAPEIARDGAVALLLAGGALANDAILEPSEKVEGGYESVGDPTEGALVVAAARVGLWKEELERVLPRVGELPFDSDRKRMSTLHHFAGGQLPEPLLPIWERFPEEIGNNEVVFTKGAVDSLLEVSDRVWVDNQPQALTDEWCERITQANNRLAENGMRVLGVAFRLRPAGPTEEIDDPLERNLIFVGMTGMIDPARPEVKDAVHVAETAGIKPIMITGDHPLTALHIARELGITKQSRVVTGQELATMPQEELEAMVQDVSVFARVSPEHKLRIVEALQDRGQIVAMTGDGVNDAPALKKADIGVAMGITGTDVSKEAADMVLLDDNFATIVAAVEEGRRIYDNILKFIRYIIPSNAGEITVMLLGPFFGLPLPLTPLQILWINLVTDGLPGLALTVEPAERNVMDRPPYNPKENIFGRGMATRIIWVGLLMGAVSLASGLLYYHSSLHNWQTMIFTTLTMAQMGNALANRSNRDTLFEIGILSNKAMLGAVLLTIVLQLAVIYIPFLQAVFGTVALRLQDLLISLAMSAVVFVAIEVVKVVNRKRERSRV